MTERQEQGVGVYLIRVNWLDDSAGGKQRSREVWSSGLFDDEETVQQEVKQLNTVEKMIFGVNSKVFYDWCVYTFLSSGDIPY